ncbi:MAG: ABC transporter permease, partial [Gemmatimonadetes bacterium]|nr:ABC transporter permease [Gemmatimonadota bacterium]
MSDSDGKPLWLRILLRLQPPSVRRDYGEEWLETAGRRDRDAAARGWWAWWAHRSREAGGALRAALSGRRNSRQWEAGMMEGWKQDLRYATRALMRGPGFTLVSVLVLGVGIGATTTIFSGVHAVLVAPLPFEEPERLVALWERNPDFGWEQEDAAPANVLDWRARVDAFADVAAYQGNSLGAVTWVSDGEPRRLAVAQVTGNFFDVLGLRPHLGRWPGFEDTWAGGEPWVVLSHRLWQESFGADPDVVGRTLEVEGWTARVRAVAPPGVRFPADETELWAPYGWSRDAVDEAWFRRAHFVQPIARLVDGVT